MMLKIALTSISLVANHVCSYNHTHLSKDFTHLCLPNVLPV